MFIVDKFSFCDFTRLFYSFLHFPSADCAISCLLFYTGICYCFMSICALLPLIFNSFQLKIGKKLVMLNFHHSASQVSFLRFSRNWIWRLQSLFLGASLFCLQNQVLSVYLSSPRMSFNRRLNMVIINAKYSASGLFHMYAFV